MSNNKIFNKIDIDRKIRFNKTLKTREEKIKIKQTLETVIISKKYNHKAKSK
jgi:hypothetical protein